MKVRVNYLEPDGELWDIQRIEGTMSRMGHSDTWIQLNTESGKKIFPLSNIVYIDIINENVLEVVEKGGKQ